MRKSPFHLEIVAGPDKGAKLVVPRTGATLGRASENNFVLTDPLLSRQHCRFDFRSGNTLWVQDLQSANQTLVNDQPIEAQPVRKGERIVVGDTTLLVCGDKPVPAEADGKAATRNDESAAAPPPIVDLGFEADDETEKTARLPVRFWWFLAGTVGLLLLLALIFRLSGVLSDPSTTDVRVVDPPAEAQRFELRYEKIDAHTNNIFRYNLALGADHMLTVRIDDLLESRHLRKEQAVSPSLVRDLEDAIRRSGFFALDERYEGLSETGEIISRDIEIILGRHVHRTVVQNRTEPPAFRAVRERIETFSQNELGIWALQYPRERLIEMAYDALLLGQKRFSERDVTPGNLWASITRYREAEFYLETIDPKPDFYPEIVTGLRDAVEQLDERYADRRFQADRALNLQDWQTAARELRLLMEMIPDRRDERHQEAQRKLLDVESRLRIRRRS